MRILIDLLSIIPRVNAGGETYVCGLVEALGRVDRENEYLIILTAESRLLFSEKPPNFQFKIIRINNRSRIKRILYEQFILPIIARGWRADLVWFPANMMSLLLPWTGILSMLTIHDFSPGFYKKHFPLYVSAKRTWLLVWLTKQSARQATLIVAVSEFSRSEIRENTNADPRKIYVLYSGTPTRIDNVSADVDLASKYGLQRPYVLLVGRTNKHKNLDRFIEAFMAVKSANNLPHHVVIAGPAGSGHTDVLAAIGRSSASGFVHITGYIDDAELQWLYSEADLFAMPSLYEGFGFPVLEAMRHGIPCLLSTAGSLPEVGGDAALYVDPYDNESIEQGLLEALTNLTLRGRLQALSAAHVTEFCWETTARRAVTMFSTLSDAVH